MHDKIVLREKGKNRYYIFRSKYTPTQYDTLKFTNKRRKKVAGSVCKVNNNLFFCIQREFWRTSPKSGDINLVLILISEQLTES